MQDLLNPNPALRLGMRKGGFADIKQHPWFLGIDWEKLRNKKYKIPSKPPFRAEHNSFHTVNTGHCMDEWAKFSTTGVCEPPAGRRQKGGGIKAKAAAVAKVEKEKVAAAAKAAKEQAAAVAQAEKEVAAAVAATTSP